MSVQYSPICDSDLRAYYLYLLACAPNVSSLSAVGRLLFDDSGDCVGSGASWFGDRLLCGEGQKQQRVSTVVGDIDSFGPCTEAVNCDVLDVDSGTGVGSDCVDSNLVGDSDDASGSRRIEKSGLGEGSNLFRNRIKRERKKRRKMEKKNFPGFGQDRVSDDGFVGRVFLTRGQNYERNKKNRDEKKENKKKNQKKWKVNQRFDLDRKCAMAGNWREPKGLSGDAKFGFFSNCSQGVQVQLRESRAEMLIAENKRRAAEEAIKLKRLESPQTFVSEFIRVSAMADKLRKQTADQKIGGWAETIADSLTRSVASGAPSTVPSLESVGYGKSALRSSDGESLDPERVRAYESSLKIVQDAFDLMEVHSEEDYELAIQRVKDDFSDVAYTRFERERKEIVAKVSFAMANSGVGYDCIERVISSIS